VYLGALASPSSPILGSVLGYIGIFLPGQIIQNALLPFWTKMRTRPRLNSFLKGIACGAVGLVYTAVYRLWKIGLLTPQAQQGSSLENEAWFVLICAAAFVACKWYGIHPAVAIILGGLLGMIWYGVVKP
jgi:chromate transport protein ChrA